MKRRARAKEKEIKELKNRAVYARFTEAEYEDLRLKAFKANLPLAVLVADGAKGVIVKEAITPEQMVYIRALAGVANNLNQVTRALHKEGVLKVATKVETMLAEIEKILNG